MIAQIFRRDRRSWNKEEVQAVELFFKCNRFFSKFYDDRYFEEIVNMSFYGRVSSTNPLMLLDNKRPSVIVLLSGNVVVQKKQTEKKRKKSKLQNQFKEVGEFIGYNETIELFSEAKVKSLHGQNSQIIYVPSSLYNSFSTKLTEENNELTFSLLKRNFKIPQKRPLMELAQSGCTIETLKINNYVYREGQKPEAVFIILEGSMKMQRPGFSNKLNDIVVISAEALVGDKDICFPERQSSLRCCSANGRLLKIPKSAFLRFAKLCLPNYKIQTEDKYMSPKKDSQKSKNKESVKLPMIMRFHSAKRSKEVQEHEYRLIKNSHILLQASPPSKNTKIRTRSSFSDYPRDIMAEKLKLYKKIRPVESKLDLSNRML